MPRLVVVVVVDVVAAGMGLGRRVVGGRGRAGRGAWGRVEAMRA